MAFGAHPDADQCDLCTMAVNAGLSGVSSGDRMPHKVGGFSSFKFELAFKSDLDAHWEARCRAMDNASNDEQLPASSDGYEQLLALCTGSSGGEEGVLSAGIDYTQELQDPVYWYTTRTAHELSAGTQIAVAGILQKLRLISLNTQCLLVIAQVIPCQGCYFQSSASICL